MAKQEQLNMEAIKNTEVSIEKLDSGLSSKELLQDDYMFHCGYSLSDAEQAVQYTLAFDDM